MKKAGLPTIAILGEYSTEFAPHSATIAAIAHSSSALGAEVDAIWVPTDDIDHTLFDNCDAIWVAPGSPYKNMTKTLWAIRRARENQIPCLGTCGGFQHMVIEFARTVLGFADAQHAEYDPYASNLFVSRLACKLVGREMQLRFVEGSRVAEMYGALSAVEQYYCNFGVNPNHAAALSLEELRIVGADDEGEIRVIEIPNHRFYVGTLFVPQMKSTQSKPHPLVNAFLRAAVDG